MRGWGTRGARAIATTPPPGPAPPTALGAATPAGYVGGPLGRTDCCLVSDGGAAVIVTSAERAKTLRKRPVYIMGMGQSHPASDIGQRYPILETGATGSGATAFKMAGIEPKDVDVAELYDCFTITVMMTLEEYGFCKKGEGGVFVEK